MANWEDKTVFEPIERYPEQHLWQRMLLHVVNFILKIFWHPRLSGLENLPAQGPVVLAVNHVSFIDIPLILCSFRPWVYLMAKKELYRRYLPNAFFSSFGAIPVDREQLKLSSVKRAMTVLKSGRCLGIFPEGTRMGAGRNPEEFRPSSGAVYFAAKAKCPIVPACIERPYKLFKSTKVVVGKPVSVEELSDLAGSRNQDAMARHLMKIIYDLQDYSYDVAAGEQTVQAVQAE